MGVINYEHGEAEAKEESQSDASTTEQGALDSSLTNVEVKEEKDDEEVNNASAPAVGNVTPSYMCTICESSFQSLDVLLNHRTQTHMSQPTLQLKDPSAQIPISISDPQSALNVSSAVSSSGPSAGASTSAVGIPQGIQSKGGGSPSPTTPHSSPQSVATDNEKNSSSNGKVKVLSYPPVEYNRRVLCSVVENLTKKQRNYIKILLRRENDMGFGIPREQLRDFTTNEKLIDCLEDNKLLSINNTWFIQYLIFLAKNKKVHQAILDFMAQRMTQEQPVCVYEPGELRVRGGIHVQLKVAGDVDKFLNMDVETFRQILAENCGEKVHYTNLVGINNGCVKLSFNLPSSCKEILVDHAKNQADWLLSNGIFQVCIDEQVEFILPKSEHQGPTPAQIRAKLLRSIIKTTNPSDATNEMPISKILVNSAVGGKPFLHWACELNKPKWVDFLLANGADVNNTDEFGCTALHKVSFLGWLEIRKKLVLQEGVNHFVKDEESRTPLMIARKEGHKDIEEIFQAVKMKYRRLGRKRNPSGPIATKVKLFKRACVTVQP